MKANEGYNTFPNWGNSRFNNTNLRLHYNESCNCKYLKGIKNHEILLKSGSSRSLRSLAMTSRDSLFSGKRSILPYIPLPAMSLSNIGLIHCDTSGLVLLKGIRIIIFQSEISRTEQLTIAAGHLETIMRPVLLNSYSPPHAPSLPSPLPF